MKKKTKQLQELKNKMEQQKNRKRKEKKKEQQKIRDGNLKHSTRRDRNR